MTATPEEVLDALQKQCECLSNLEVVIPKGKYLARAIPIKTRQRFSRDLYFGIGTTRHRDGTYSVYVGIWTRSDVQNPAGRKIAKRIRELASECTHPELWLGPEWPSTNHWPIFMFLLQDSTIERSELNQWAKDMCALFCPCVKAVLPLL